ncbi:glycosyltransferase family 4 protein [Starkeya sp. ORNL1]|uniref:glycosyltransferase family 4 protein n=1 Tax=Starkeya sp. ORNL1 TaxID=2709380 RepID=UPI001FEDD590|nr:glycosyltransferase family 4 protein [Starkeya sp. ORNL1]
MADRQWAERHLAFAIPGDLEAPTGGYGYDRRLMDELRALGWEIEHIALPGGFPSPSDAERGQALAALTALPLGTPLMIDGLAFGVMDREAPQLAARGPLIALVHHPLANETGLAADHARALRASEWAALSHAGRVVVTSPATATALTRDFEVAAERIVVAVPGTDPAAFARGSGGPGVQLIAVGSLIPRKGHLDLLAALEELRALDWWLDLVGDPGLDPAHAAEIVAAIHRYALSERVALHGPLGRAELDALYDSADIFVLASHYEGYGMAYAEGIARGLPVVGTTGGAIAETVGAAGELVPPGHPRALAGVLAKLIADPAHRARRAEAARAAAPLLPTWADTARRVADAIASTGEATS